MRLGPSARPGPVVDREPDLPPLRAIPLTRSQGKVVYRTLGWIKKHTGTRSWTVALEWCGADYASTYHSGDPVPATVPSEGPTRPFHYRPYPDQVEVIDEALALARDAVGLDDEGAALAHVCAVFAATYIAPARAGEPGGA